MRYRQLVVVFIVIAIGGASWMLQGSRGQSADVSQSTDLLRIFNDDQEKTMTMSGKVLFEGGYQTDAVDRGRPVTLIAAALNVSPEVFRDAFSRVTPSRGGPPSPTLARANKKALMDALGKYGVTNERLDAVSDHYRYRPERDELWKHTPAQAKAIIEHGKVVGFELVKAGAGYSSAPLVKVMEHPGVKVKATIEFTNDLKTNGRIKSLELVP